MGCSNVSRGGAKKQHNSENVELDKGEKHSEKGKKPDINVEYIHMFDDEDPTKLLIYSLSEKSLRIIQLNDIPILKEFDSMQVGERIFICGGEDLSSKYLNLTYEVNESKPEFIERCKMQLARSQHSLAYLSKFIYCAGGCDESGLLDLCEKYNIHTDKWESFPCLNEKKSSISLCSFKPNYLFCIGGENIAGDVATIEMINTGNIEEHLSLELISKKETADLDTNRKVEEELWIIIKLDHNQGWGPRNKVGCIQIAHQILIFGGDFEGDDIKQSFLFNPMERRIVKLDAELEKGDWFGNRKGAVVPEKMEIIIFGLPGFLHRYNFQQQTWNMDLVETQ
jgi:hypothetical protein